MISAGLFVSLYSAVERLVVYQDQGSKAASRCILLHEFCPALHSLLEDGLKVGTFLYNYYGILSYGYFPRDDKNSGELKVSPIMIYHNLSSFLRSCLSLVVVQEEVITSFGRMKTSVWRVLEAVIQGGPAQRNTCDLVMLLNTKFSSEEDFKKFSGFVIGLLK